MFLECVPVGDLEANCFVLCDEKTKIGAIIDPGEYTEEVKNIKLGSEIRCKNQTFIPLCVRQDSSGCKWQEPNSNQLKPKRSTPRQDTRAASVRKEDFRKQDSQWKDWIFLNPFASASLGLHYLDAFKWLGGC